MPKPPNSEPSSPPNKGTRRMGTSAKQEAGQNIPIDRTTPLGIPLSEAERDTLSKKSLAKDEFLFSAELKSHEVFLGKYEILRVIGTGGMGRVYLARHIGLDILYAIKVISYGQTQDQDAVKRFEREAQMSARIEHPNAVRVFDFGVQDNICYLVMEYLNGENLRQRLTRCKRFSVEEMLHFAEQLCYVLGVMHRKRIIHRDLKPDNILFHRVDDTGEIIKVLDFGVAKFSSETQPGFFQTKAGTVVGTPSYMSPEQCQGHWADARSDVYSLGVILYEMLSGRAPFSAPNPLSVMYLHVNQPPTPLRDVSPDIPAPIADVIMQMLAKSPDDRIQSAQEVLQALFRAAGITTPSTIDAIDLSWSDAGSTRNPSTSETQPLQTATQTKIDTLEKEPLWVASSVMPIIGWAAIGLVLLIAGGVGWQLWLQFKPALNSNLPTVTTMETKPVAPGVLEQFVRIPGGVVTIGRDALDCRTLPKDQCAVTLDEVPPHQVRLDPYVICKYEVTNAEYQEFVLATKYSAPPGWRKSTFPIGENHFPVVNVSWNDAIAYCQWRTKTNRDGIPFRLPTEAEWEYAARGNDTRLFPWGDTWNPSFANFNHSDGSPLSVFKAPNNTEDQSPFGVFGLAGNVSEWTSSRFTPYPKSVYRAKKDDLECYVFRGGSFSSIKASDGRTSARFWEKPSARGKDIGFRLAATLP